MKMWNDTENPLHYDRFDEEVPLIQYYEFPPNHNELYELEVSVYQHIQIDYVFRISSIYRFEQLNYYISY